MLDPRLPGLHEDHQLRPRVAWVAVPGELGDRADLLRGQRKRGTSETARARKPGTERRARIANDDHRVQLTTGRSASTHEDGDTGADP